MPNQSPGDTSLPPGTVTNLAGRTSPQPSCSPPKTTEQLAPTTSWSSTINVPSSLFAGKPAGANTTETFSLATNGTFTASDGSGNSFALAPLGGLPAGNLSASIVANSTAALQTFTVTSGGMIIASATVSYFTITSFCYPAGLRMEISGNVAWPGNSGIVSIPFKSQPTFAPVTKTKDNATAPYNPTRATFGHGKGLAIGFDWSDSKKLNPAYDDRTNSVDYQVGDTFLIDPVVTASTSGSFIATKTDYEGFTCYASGRYWVFFDTGSYEGMASSADLSSWVVRTFNGNGLHGLFGFFCSGNTLYYAAASSLYSGGIDYGYGTLEPDGTFAPAITPGFIPASDQYAIRGVSTTIDSAGGWWIALGEAPVEVWHCATPSACSWTESASFASSAGYPDVVPLTTGRMAVVWTTLGYNTMGNLVVATYSGTGWSSPVTDAVGQYRIDASTCVSVGDEVGCGVDNNDAAVGFISASYGNNQPAWSSFKQVAACSSQTDCYASLSTGGHGSLAMTFAKSTSTVGFLQSFDSGADWSFESDFSTGETNPVYVSSPFYLGDRILAVWTTSNLVFGVPVSWNVRFAEALTTSPAGPTPPWGQPGLSPYGSYVSNAQVYVSMGNGLLSIEQPTFTLPGRGLSVSPALFYNEPGSFGLFDRPFRTDNFTLANLGLGWSLNLPWLGTNYVHLPDGQEYPYAWSGTDMQVHGPVDFELTAASVSGNSFSCPCTLIMPSGVEFKFNGAKQLLSESDPIGNTVGFAYGTNGILSSIVDTVGRVTTFGYNSADQLATITAPGGRAWSLAYSGARLSSVTDPVARTTSFGYNSTLGSGWLVGEVDYPMLGAKVTLSYGVGVVSSGAAYVVTSRHVYSATGVISQSNYLSYVFDNGTLFDSSLAEAGGNGLLQGIVTKVFLPNAGVEKTYYSDQLLRVFRVTEDDYTANRLTATKIEDPSGNILAETDMQYDGWGNVVYTKDNVGQQTWMSYANTNLAGAFANPACGMTGFYANSIEANVHDRLVGSCDFQDGAGSPQQESFYQYDNNGLLVETRVSHAGGWLYTDYTHDAYGNVISVKDADGNYAYYTYSSAYGGAYLTRESRAVGVLVMATLYAYDSNTGFITSTKDPNDQTTSYTYDAVGRPLTEIYPAANGASSVVSYSYDDTNGVVTTTDPNGNVVKGFFDGLGRATQLQVFDGKKLYSNTHYSYNWMDKVSRVQLPSGSVYAYTYDSLGRPLSQTNPDGARSTVSYNDVNNIVAATDEDGHQTLYYYDWGGRLLMVQQQASASLFYFTTYSYDKAGNLVSTLNPDGQVTSYSYDDLDRLTQVVGPDGNSTSYSHDSVGNLVSKTTPNGATISYAYDSANRLTGATYPDGSTTSYAYDLDSNVLSVSSTLSGTTEEAFTYDAMSRLTSTTTTVAGGSYTTSYSYDQASNPVSVTYPDGLVVPMSYDFANRLASVRSFATFSYNVDGTVAQVAFGDHEVQSYSYDSRDRVTSIADTYHKATPLNITYSYDPASNVAGLNSKAFTYDGMNRLTSATGGWGTTTCSYNGAGDMLASTTGGVTTGYANSVSANVRVTCKTDKNGNVVSKSGGWTYAYDYEDEMVTASLNGVTKQTNVYDGLGNRVEETGLGSAVFTYQGVNLLYEKNLTSGVGADQVYGDGMQLAKVVGGSTTTYFHEDQLGSNRAETSVAKGKVTTQFSADYQPYGQSYGVTGSEPFQFTDRMLDSSTGLYYFNARFYDPSIMRFMQKDPGGLDAVSQYMYANDNPLAYTDPTGQFVVHDCYVGCGQLLSWYKSYVWDAPDREACDAGDQRACRIVYANVLGGVVAGDVIFEGAEVVIRAATFEEAGNGLRAALARPGVRSITFLLDPTSEEFGSWFRAAATATEPERWRMAQGFYSELFRRAGYETETGEVIDIFARSRLRSLVGEVKSSLEGGYFGGQREIAQLEGYLTVAERRGAQRFLATIGINSPMELSGPLRSYVGAENVLRLDVRWVPPGETLLSYL